MLFRSVEADDYKNELSREEYAENFLFETTSAGPDKKSLVRDEALTERKYLGLTASKK